MRSRAHKPRHNSPRGTRPPRLFTTDGHIHKKVRTRCYAGPGAPAQCTWPGTGPATPPPASAPAPPSSRCHAAAQTHARPAQRRPLATSPLRSRPPPGCSAARVPARARPRTHTDTSNDTQLKHVCTHTHDADKCPTRSYHHTPSHQYEPQATKIHTPKHYRVRRSTQAARTSAVATGVSSAGTTVPLRTLWARDTAREVIYSTDTDTHTHIHTNIHTELR